MKRECLRSGLFYISAFFIVVLVSKPSMAISVEMPVEATEVIGHPMVLVDVPIECPDAGRISSLVISGTYSGMTDEGSASGPYIVSACLIPPQMSCEAVLDTILEGSVVSRVSLGSGETSLTMDVSTLVRGSCDEIDSIRVLIGTFIPDAEVYCLPSVDDSHPYWEGAVVYSK